jgi:hypothetical protein
VCPHRRNSHMLVCRHREGPACAPNAVGRVPPSRAPATAVADPPQPECALACSSRICPHREGPACTLRRSATAHPYHRSSDALVRRHREGPPMRARHHSHGSTAPPRGAHTRDPTAVVRRKRIEREESPDLREERAEGLPNPNPCLYMWT